MAGARFAIRHARPGEHQDLGELTVRVYRQVLGSDLTDYSVVLRDVAGRLESGCLVFVAVQGPRLLGGITYVAGPGPLAQLTIEGEAEIRMLVVDPAFEGQGVGAALVRACVDEAIAASRVGVVLGTMAAMVAAQRLYLRLGFQRRPERDSQVGDGAALLCYSLDLESASPPS